MKPRRRKQVNDVLVEPMPMGPGVAAILTSFPAHFTLFKEDRESLASSSTGKRLIHKRISLLPGNRVRYKRLTTRWHLSRPSGPS